LRTDDAQPVAECLDLAEDVAREEYRAALRADRVDLLAEDRFHERVEARGGFVEDEQVDVGGEGGDEGDLLPVALGVGAALLGGVELEALDEGGALGGVEAAAEPAEEVDDLAAGEGGPERDVTGHVGEAAVEGLDVGPRVAAEEDDRAGVGAQQPEEDAQGRGLAGAVGAEEAVDLAGPDLEVEAVEGDGRAEGLVEVADLDRSTHDMSVHSVQKKLNALNS